MKVELTTEEILEIGLMNYITAISYQHFLEHDVPRIVKILKEQEAQTK